MEMNKEEMEVGQQLATKIKIPKDVREKIYTKLFKEFGIAILIFIYFILLNLGYLRLEKAVFSKDLKVFSGILIISTIIVFEIAYRKDSDSMALHGIELMVLSIITLFMPYIYFYRGLALRFLYSFSAMYIAIYYSIKALIIYEIEVRKYKNGLSDVKEIVEEKEESYLDEKNERKFQEENLEEENEKVKSKKKKEERIKEIIKENGKKKNKKTEKASKKDENTEKKENAVEKEKSTAKKSTTKKKSTSKPKEDAKKDGEVKPKRKRGRPRKNPIENKIEKENGDKND